MPRSAYKQQVLSELAPNDKNLRQRDKPRIEPIRTVINELETIK
jgi:hypothetical protein